MYVVNQGPSYTAPVIGEAEGVYVFYGYGRAYPSVRRLLSRFGLARGGYRSGVAIGVSAIVYRISRLFPRGGIGDIATAGALASWDGRVHGGMFGAGQRLSHRPVIASRRPGRRDPAASLNAAVRPHRMGGGRCTSMPAAGRGASAAQGAAA